MNVAPLNTVASASSPAGNTAGIVGAGVMGQGIAQLFAVAGYDVRLYDIDRGRAEVAVAQAVRMIDRDAAKGRMPPAAAEAAKARLTVASVLGELKGAAIVIEAIVEDLDAKQTLFKELEELVAPDCILATNTSSLLVTAIASAARQPERICGLHFFNPVPLMKVVEVIAGVKTAPAVIERVKLLVGRTGHATVVCADMPGFLINHAGRGLYTEGLRIVSEGIASIQDVDAVLRDCAGFRMGPFQLFDLTGLDVSFKVLTQIYHKFFEEPRFRPSPLVERQHAAGLYGRKVGQGFYVYRDGEAVVAPPAAADAEEAPRPLWIHPGPEPGPSRLRRRMTELGLRLDAGPRPDADSIVLIAPVGDDATTTAVAAGLDPERTLAIDTLLDLDRRITVMTTTVTQPRYRNSLLAMLQAANVRATAIHDSPGFIVQRVVATIVNIACDIAQQRIASPADIDLGVKIGLNYPDGPLAIGDRVGAPVVLDILNRMHAFYGDPRYRPSPWLKRRAALGRSLTTEEA